MTDRQRLCSSENRGSLNHNSPYSSVSVKTKKIIQGFKSLTLAFISAYFFIYCYLLPRKALQSIQCFHACSRKELTEDSDKGMQQLFHEKRG